jgi:hypothetical protein
MSPPPPPLDVLASRAVSSWRRARAAEGAAAGGAGGLLAAAGAALAFEWLAVDGLVPHKLPILLAIPLGTATLGAVRAALRRPTLLLGASELDRRASLDDRVSTALEFASLDSEMARLQRADAERRSAGLDPAPHFAVAWRRRLRAPAAAALLLLLVASASLLFRLAPSPQVPESPVDSSAAELLAAIDREAVVHATAGDKAAVRLLRDLEQRVRRIQAREKELRRTLARRAPPPEEEPAAPVPPPEPPAESPEAATQLPDDAQAALDEAALETEIRRQMGAMEGQQNAMLADVLRQSGAARKVAREFWKMHEQELHAELEADDRKSPFGRDDASDLSRGRINETALTPDASLSSRLGGIPDPSQDAETILKRTQDKESITAHESQHDMQQLFKQFLESVAKDVQEMAVRSAMGRKQPKPNQPKVTARGEQGVVDKTAQMAQSGFREMGEVKRMDGGGAPEQMAGDPATAQPGAAPPSEIRSGDGTGPMAMSMPGQATGDTSAGASGAGTGKGHEGGFQAALDAVVQPGEGPLERVLGQVQAGRMPEEERERLFDRVARHKMEAGPGSEADDVLVDYWVQAEEEMSEHRDELPPLFRDFAQSYFESIRPGSPESP